MSIKKKITKEMIDRHRKTLGCKNVGKVCWCGVCTTIEKIVTQTIDNVIHSITNDN